MEPKLLSRVLVERKAINLNPKHSTILASAIGLMSDQDVVLLACGVQDWYAQDDFNTGESFLFLLWIFFPDLSIPFLCCACPCHHFEYSFQVHRIKIIILLYVL